MILLSVKTKRAYASGVLTIISAWIMELRVAQDTVGMSLLNATISHIVCGTLITAYATLNGIYCADSTANRRLATWISVACGSLAIPAVVWK